MKQQMCPADLSADITATYTTVSGVLSAVELSIFSVKLFGRVVAKSLLSGQQLKDFLFPFAASLCCEILTLTWKSFVQSRNRRYVSTF